MFWLFIFINKTDDRVKYITWKAPLFGYFQTCVIYKQTFFKPLPTQLSQSCMASSNFSFLSERLSVKFFLSTKKLRNPRRAAPCLEVPTTFWIKRLMMLSHWPIRLSTQWLLYSRPTCHQPRELDQNTLVPIIFIILYYILIIEQLFRNEFYHNFVFKFKNIKFKLCTPTF